MQIKVTQTVGGVQAYWMMSTSLEEVKWPTISIFSSDAATRVSNLHQWRQRKIRETDLCWLHPQCPAFVTVADVTLLSSIPPSYITAHTATQWPPFIAPASRLCSMLRGINFETPSKPQRDLWGDESFTAPLQLPPPSSLPHTSACKTGSRADTAAPHQDAVVVGGRSGSLYYMVSITLVFIHELEGKNMPRAIRKNCSG